MSSMEIGSIGAGAAGTSWDEFGPILSLEDTESPDSVWLQASSENPAAGSYTGGVAQFNKRNRLSSSATRHANRNSGQHLSTTPNFDSRPALSTRLRALSALEARGEIDATQKGALKDALIANDDIPQQLGEALDRVGAEAIRLAMLHDQRVRDPRGTRATDAMTVSSLGAELENLMSLDDVGDSPILTAAAQQPVRRVRAATREWLGSLGSPPTPLSGFGTGAGEDAPRSATFGSFRDSTGLSFRESTMMREGAFSFNDDANAATLAAGVDATVGFEDPSGTRGTGTRRQRSSSASWRPATAPRDSTVREIGAAVFADEWGGGFDLELDDVFDEAPTVRQQQDADSCDSDEDDDDDEDERLPAALRGDEKPAAMRSLPGKKAPPAGAARAPGSTTRAPTQKRKLSRTTDAQQPPATRRAARGALV